MRTLVYDTETTGRADFKRGVSLHSQPYLVQLGAILYNGKRVVAELNLITIPEYKDTRAPIDPEAEKVHGIDNALIDAVGVPYRIAVPMFNQLLRRADRVVCHNVAHDDLIMRATYSRLAAPQDVLTSAATVCTMKTLEPVLKLPGKWAGKFKYPSLMEAYQLTVNPQGFDGAHDAMADVRATADVFFACEAAGYALHRGDRVVTSGEL